MSGKLDQSLDQIMKDTKPSSNRFRGRRAPRKAKTQAKTAIAAPTAGVQKSKPVPKAPRTTTTATTTGSQTGMSKIIVSNLPEDVTETQIKDYFGKTVGHIKTVLLTYGPTGRSRGVAQITFSSATSGSQAAKQLDGVKVDNKPMRIEVVVGAKQAPAAPAPKTLADRMSKPKSAAKDKPKTNGTAITNGANKGKSTRAKKPGRNNRPKKKTAEELDAEMQDYFGGDSGAATTTAQPAAAVAGGDTGMVDEVL